MAATLRRYGLWKCRIPRAAVSLGPIEGQQEKPDGKKESAMSYKSDIEIAREAKKRPIQEIGDKIAQSILDWFAVAENRAIIERLRTAGLQLELHADDNAPTSDTLKGMTFVVSGVFQHFSRDGIKASIGSGINCVMLGVEWRGGKAQTTG